MAAMLISPLEAQGPRRAPSWALVDSNGQMHDLLDYRGKYLILEFMQTNCPHCATFAEVLGQAQQRYGDKVAILSVVSIPQDNANTVQQFVAGHKITYPIVFDAGQMQYSYVLKPKVSFPQVYIIDPTGLIRGDYGYDLTTRDIFEGKGFLAQLDRVIGAPKK
jgi:peroxiredoxin